MSDPQTPETIDPDYALVDRLFTLHPPASAEAGLVMDDIRFRYMSLANEIVGRVPRTPDRAIALRSLHRACMDAIAAIACNQDLL
jgi:hypothetical protein